MMRRSFALMSAALSLSAVTPLAIVSAQYGMPPANVGDVQRYSANQLDNLVGPIALYPDALLAQVLVAATFPDQVEEAARYVRTNGNAGIDEQNWDVSVKAVAHYPSALNRIADQADWTATLGRAYANQSGDVMLAVQRMRALANSQGNLQSTPQQQVISDNGNYVIVPTQPRVIYVPVYDPYVIYTQPIFNVGYSSRFWSFGIGFPIGGWLSYDLDWRRRSVYYNGWDDAYFSYGGGWRARSRPYVQITNVYVNSSYRNVYINRDVDRHVVNYRNVDRYAVGVHRDTYFDARHADYRDRDGRERDTRDRFADGLPRTAQPRSDEPRDRRPVTPPPGSLPATADNGRARSEQRAAEARESRRNEPSSRAGEMSVMRPDRPRSGDANAPTRAEPQVDARGQGRVGRERAPNVEPMQPQRVDAPRGVAPRAEAPRGEVPRSEAPRVEHESRQRSEKAAPSQERRATPREGGSTRERRG